MSKAAICAAGGIGDGLLMMIAYEQLSRAGHTCTLFHEKAAALQSLFPKANLQPPTSDLDGFDLIVVENDNSKFAWDLIRRRESLPIHFLFPTPSKAQTSKDFLFDKRLPVATNIANAIGQILRRAVSKENGLPLPEGLTRQKHKKRIVIHPTSADVNRNWLPNQFLRFARGLKARGFTVAFAVSKSERPYWEHVLEEGFLLPPFSSLKETADYIYESALLIGNDSGLGHLASNLSIPTLTISGNKKRVKLWRPDWAANKIVTLHIPLPNFKGINFRMRERCWHSFMPVSRVLRSFERFYAKTVLTTS